MCEACGQPLCENCGGCHNEGCGNYVEPGPECEATDGEAEK
jgi:hypothetical protein